MLKKTLSLKGVKTLTKKESLEVSGEDVNLNLLSVPAIMIVLFAVQVVG